jgi:hypothetical protein
MCFVQSYGSSRLSILSMLASPSNFLVYYQAFKKRKVLTILIDSVVKFLRKNEFNGFSVI